MQVFFCSIFAAPLVVSVDRSVPTAATRLLRPWRAMRSKMFFALYRLFYASLDRCSLCARPVPVACRRACAVGARAPPRRPPFYYMWTHVPMSMFFFSCCESGSVLLASLRRSIIRTRSLCPIRHCDTLYIRLAPSDTLHSASLYPTRPLHPTRSIPTRTLAPSDSLDPTRSIPTRTLAPSDSQ